MMPTREHRCTCCGQDIARSFRPVMWATFMLFAFLLFSAAVFVASLWLKR